MDCESRIICGNCLEELKKFDDKSIQCCITSPPYWNLRDYGIDEQLGLEKTPEEYVDKLVNIFREVRRILCNDWTLWLNLGDSYASSMKGSNSNGTWQDRSNCKQGTNVGALKLPPQKASSIGLKPKDLVGIPWRVAFALQADGWYLRQDIIWHKPNPMPESVKDRCTKSHEYIFLLSKSAKYFFDTNAIKEPAVQNRWGGHKPINTNNSKDIDNQFSGLTRERDMMPEFRNCRDVWSVVTKPYKGAHFATFPEKLIEPCVKAGCPIDGIVIDPFFGAGTVGVVAEKLGRRYIGIDLKLAYVEMAKERIAISIKNKK